MTLEEYYTDFIQDVFARADADKNFTESIFTERMCEFLLEQAVVENYQVVEYKKSDDNMRVDAWEFNEDSGQLTLFISDFRHNPDLESLTRTDMERLFKRVERFFKSSVKPEFYKSLDVTSPGFELAREISKNISLIERLHCILLTNAELSKRVESLSDTKLNDIDITYSIWDISRLYRIESSGRAREDMVIDFREYRQGTIPCLPAFTGDSASESYLLVMPGELLADLYDKYGERLLEQNVRTFLQFRGSVNGGIRNTLLNEPSMFFSYNNGIAATAEAVAVNQQRTRIESVRNLQIVNGGQTTASIFASMKKKVDISAVYVQVKLTVVRPDDVEVVVPRISEFANTQNKVNAADFFSNHPFHLRMEEISRRLWAPSSEGALRESHWFYERARGQYANSQLHLSVAKKKEFLSKNPRQQMFTKTELAKFENCFALLPQVVSLGAEKNFGHFVKDVCKRWESDEAQFNELYFKHFIAKGITFRHLDRVVLKQPWYGGYKANIVAYAIAMLVKLIMDKGKRLNLDKIWSEQRISRATSDQLLKVAKLVNERIQHTPDGITNVTEWCKKDRCWASVQTIDVVLSDDLMIELVEPEALLSKFKDAKQVQKVDNGIHEQVYVIEKGWEYWAHLHKWSHKARVLTPKEDQILSVASEPRSNKIPTEKQCAIIVGLERRALKDGFPG
jgi:hypothetical protein